MAKAHIGLNVTDQEKATVELAATIAGVTLSDYVKGKLGLTTQGQDSPASDTSDSSTSPATGTGSSTTLSISSAQPLIKQTSEEELHELKAENLRLKNEGEALKNEIRRLNIERKKLHLPAAAKARLSMNESERNGVKVPATWEGGEWRPSNRFEKKDELATAPSEPCQEPSCNIVFAPGLAASRDQHLIKEHKYFLDASGHLRAP